jgi:leucyl-tRNA synthetase
MERVWELVINTPQADGEPTEAQLRDLRRKQHQAIRRVTQDIEDFTFNTMVAGLMEYVNALNAIRSASPAVTGDAAWQGAVQTLVLLMAPGFPHIAEEMWERLGQSYSVHQQNWPVWDEELAKEDVIEIAVQVNGKVRDKIEVPVDVDPEDAKSQAQAAESVARHIDGKNVVKVIYVPGRLVNIVTASK